jgi:hypothetical protein
LLLLNDYFHSRSGLKWYDGNNMTAFINSHKIFGRLISLRIFALRRTVLFTFINFIAIALLLHFQPPVL